MSIAIVLIPLVLPAIPILIGMRIVLGEEGFKNMIDSLQLRMPTSIKRRDELKNILEISGYELKEWMGTSKTHLVDGSFLTWEFDGQRWVAVFSKHANQKLISDFMGILEAKSEKSIFSASGINSQNNGSITMAPLLTNFKDEKLLLKTLSDAGINPQKGSSGEIECSLNNTVLRFVRTKEDVFQVEMQSSVDRDVIINQLQSLDDDYRRCVQADTYHNLMAKIAERNLSVESEEVLEDNSIVITLAIQEKY